MVVSELANTIDQVRSAMRMKAMDLLARREHSALELHRKLAAKFPENCELVDEVVSGLQVNGLQSDERFAEVFVSSRVKKGQGPQRIGMELRQRGVNQQLADQMLWGGNVEWLSVAREVLVKKYGNKPCADYKERSKRSGFLHYRGFTSEQISSCFNEPEE